MARNRKAKEPDLGPRERFDAPKGFAARSQRSVILAFIEDAIKKNERGAPFALYPHQREVLRTAFAFDARGKLPWDTIVYACPKKSGKTAINAAVSLAWAFTQEPPNEIFFLANDQEQARSRAYSGAANLIRHNQLEVGVIGGLKGLTQGAFDLTTGTAVKAIASDAAGAAGSNHGFVSFDELWGYTSSAAHRLWDELTPVPTRRNSVRFITTYAGFENESKLLWELYLQGVGPEEHAHGKGVKIHDELPIYTNREAGLLIYWDHEPRLPWQTPGYYSKQRRTLRPASYLRLHENRWVSSESRFFTGEQWDACVVAESRPRIKAPDLRVYVGVDAAVKKDSCAAVAVTWNADTQKVELVNTALWQPTPGDPVDLEETVEATLREWSRVYALAKVRYDPYQFVSIAQRLEREGLPMEEYPQTSDRLTAIGQTMWDLVTGRNLALYPSDDLRAHALNAVCVETTRGWRIAKEKARFKVDMLVALAMAAHACAGSDLGQLPLYTEGNPAAPEPLTEAAQEALEAQDAERLWREEGPWR